jgi:anti-sigma factor RsiW
MRCSKFESLIALYVENDLAESDERLVEAHLETCHGCREFAADIRESQMVLKELRMDFVEEAALQEVRAEVLFHLSTPRRTAPWPRAAVIAPPPFAAVPVLRQRVHTARVSRHHRQTTPAFKSEPLVVKIVTDDPQVVIYWLVGQNGG